MGVSLNPDTFSKGGLIQDVDVEIIGGRYTLEPPPGYTQRDRVFAELDLKVLDDDSEVTQYWSAGKNTDFTPSTDGLGLTPTGSRTTFNDNSNFSIFIQNLVNVQFPKTALTEKLDCLFGTQVHVVRIPAPEREGLEKDKDAKKNYILVPNKLIKLPGEKAKAKAGARKAAAAAPATGAAPEPAEPSMDSAEIETQALVDVTEVMGEGKALPIPLLKAQVIRRHMKTDTATRNKIVALVGDADWLATQGFMIANGAVQPPA